MIVRLTRAAEADLESLASFISQENPAAAATTVLRVLDAVDALVEFPNIGRPGRVPGTRELVVSRTPFIAVYRVEANVLWVLRVLHGAQRWPDR